VSVSSSICSSIHLPIYRVQTTFIWSTIFLHLMRELPLFDSEALRMFAISLA